uniref:Helicase n=1 Tax=uncultured marine virus TaxID=186617 RepID=A0A0F7L6W7_9VIRU|nr:helicase [uncultured marine virus]
MSETDYSAFVASKRRGLEAVGFEVDGTHESLFEHQDAIVRWSCRLGRSAVFADTGLGKTRIELDWAWQVVGKTGGQVVILTPLAVAEQTIREAALMGMDAGPIGSGCPIVVTNYEKIHRLTVTDYAGVVLDESSILKSFDGKMRTLLINAWKDTAYRLAATATPAPNDHSELGNHAEFLGICTRAEMLAEYFVHDGGSTQNWRLKGHAVEEFWRWVSTWGVLVRKPADLGIRDGRYDLPPLHVREVTVEIDHSIAQESGALFVQSALTLNDQRRMRRVTIEDRCKRIAAYAAAYPDDPILVWTELNDESAMCARLIPGAVEVKGADSPEDKAAALLGFGERQFRVMVTKPKIAGFGMNWQHCKRMVFAGPTHSYEQFYQAVRRCWRFGQTEEVEVIIITTPADGAIVSNMRRKQDAAENMAESMLELVRDAQLESVMGARPGTYTHPTKTLRVPAWLRSL